MNNYMANDVADEMTQHEYNNNKYYKNKILYTQKD